MDYFRDKSILIPPYSFIDLSKIETKLIDTCVFQRLYSIKQLSYAYVVYTSTIHTRLEHSLGCFYIANRMCHEMGIVGERKMSEL